MITNMLPEARFENQFYPRIRFTRFDGTWNNTDINFALLSIIVREAARLGAFPIAVFKAESVYTTQELFVEIPSSYWLRMNLLGSTM